MWNLNQRQPHTPKKKKPSKKVHIFHYIVDSAMHSLLQPSLHRPIIYLAVSDRHCDWLSCLSSTCRVGFCSVMISVLFLPAFWWRGGPFHPSFWVPAPVRRAPAPPWQSTCWATAGSAHFQPFWELPAPIPLLDCRLPEYRDTLSCIFPSFGLTQQDACAEKLLGMKGTLQQCSVCVLPRRGVTFLTGCSLGWVFYMHKLFAFLQQS